MVKNPSRAKFVVFPVNLNCIIDKAEAAPKANSCLVVDVITELMTMGRDAWEKKYNVHKRKKHNK